MSHKWNCTACDLWRLAFLLGVVLDTYIACCIDSVPRKPQPFCLTLGVWDFTCFSTSDVCPSGRTIYRLNKHAFLFSFCSAEDGTQASLMLGESTVTEPQPQWNGTCLLLLTYQQSSMIGNTSDPRLRCFGPMGFLFLLMCMQAMHSPWKSGFEFVSSPGLLVAWSFHDTEQWQWVPHPLSPWPLV